MGAFNVREKIHSLLLLLHSGQKNCLYLRAHTVGKSLCYFAAQRLRVLNLSLATARAEKTKALLGSLFP